MDVAYSDMTGNTRFGSSSSRREKKLRRQASDGKAKKHVEHDEEEEDEIEKNKAAGPTRRVRMAQAMVGDANPKRFQVDGDKGEDDDVENIMDIYAPDQVNGFTAFPSSDSVEDDDEDASMRSKRKTKRKSRSRQEKGATAMADPQIRHVSGFESFSSAPAAFDGHSTSPPEHVPPFVPFTTATVDEDEEEEKEEKEEDKGYDDGEEEEEMGRMSAKASSHSRASKKSHPPIDPAYLLPSNARQHLGKEKNSIGSNGSRKGTSSSSSRNRHNVLLPAPREGEDDEGEMMEEVDAVAAPNSMFYELALYVATGVILIFLAEQFIRIGVKMGEASARSAALAASSLYGNVY